MSQKWMNGSTWASSNAKIRRVIERDGGRKNGEEGKGRREGEEERERERASE